LVTLFLLSVTGFNNTCQIEINVTTQMSPPIFFYYELDGFYQNQRDYVKSRDYGQMRAAYTNVTFSKYKEF